MLFLYGPEKITKKKQKTKQNTKAKKIIILRKEGRNNKLFSHQL